MNIEEIKKIWVQDKIVFKQKELGGLQDFVKEILQSQDILNLKKGLESTHIINRKYEFTVETGKEKRRADFVIYIDKDIVIPVEVERHNNIEQGKEQLFQYQKDWSKKYGILTDGNEWRLYKSTQYKSFNIENILSNTEAFLSYWEDYIKPDNYYYEMFNPSGQQNLFKDELTLNNYNNREIFFHDITQVIENFKGKITAIADDLFQTNDKVVVETSYAYLIQFILYKVLVDNNYKKFKQEYEETLRKVKKALADEDYYSLIINEIKNISEYVAKNLYTPFQKEQESINKRLAKNLKTSSNIHDISPWLDMILFIDKYSFADLKNEVFGYIYENFLKDLYNQNHKGQYFTDPAVVNFMLKEINYNEETIKDNPKKISIIDPSCGAGTFLYSAVDKIVNALDNGTEVRAKKIEDIISKSVFGLDIEEFPLYLAEMNILMRMLPLIVNEKYENPVQSKIKIFKTKDSISEFLNIDLTDKNSTPDLFSSIQETALDYPSFMRDEKDLTEMLKSLKEVAGVRDRFDYVIGNPPYVSYNECCKQKIEFTQKIQDKNTNSITMGNVYKVNLHSIPKRKKKYAPKPNLYAFFIALGLALLKEGGKLSYIIPQTILVNMDMDVLRYYLSKFTTIDKIITFEGNMFIGRGIKQNRPVATSSLIFVVKKRLPSDYHKIKVINYSPYKEKLGIDFEDYIDNGKKEEKEVLQKDLENDVINWSYIKLPKYKINLINNYKKNSDNLSIYYEHKRAESHFVSKFYFDKGLVFEKKFYNNGNNDYFLIDKVKTNNNFKVHCKDIFIDKRNIRMPNGSQGLEVYEKKYKIIWSYMDFKHFHFSDKSIMLDYNWVIISSDNKRELQYLYSVLNSKINLFILNNLYRLSNENKLKILIGITMIKNSIKIPKITKENQFIKNEIIENTNKLLQLEDYQLKDFINFTTSVQKFKDVFVKKDKLILVDLNNNKIEQTIIKKVDFIKDLISKKFSKEVNIGLAGKDINLQDLKYMDATDKKEQNTLKGYIDDLVFALYFQVPIKNEDISNFIVVKELCKQNEFYKYINE